MSHSEAKGFSEELDELALNYYDCTDTNEKARIYEKASLKFLNAFPEIMNSKNAKKLCSIPNCVQMVEDAYTYAFFECFLNYKPNYTADSFIPFMAYFYKTAYFSALANIEKTFGRKPNPETEPEKYDVWQKKLYTENIDDHYDLEDESFDLETITEADETKNEQDTLISLFFGCIMQFYSHQDMTKSKNQNELTYFKTFYSGDIIGFSRTDDFLCFLHKYEQVITKSYNADFIDYILKNHPRTIDEIVSAKLKLYSELNDSRIPADKLQKEIKIPIEQIIYAYFFNISKPAVTKQIDKYVNFKKEVMGA